MDEAVIHLHGSAFNSLRGYDRRGLATPYSLDSHPWG
jgi:hypothetical protein